MRNVLQSPQRRDSEFSRAESLPWLPNCAFSLSRFLLFLALPVTILATPLAGAQESLFPERRVKPEFQLLNHSFYINAQYFVQQTGYEELWRRYDGHLPTGKGVVVAQCENGLADPAQLPGVEIVHVPGFTGTAWDDHAGTVSKIFYGPQPYQDKGCLFDRGFAPGVRLVFAYTSNQFRQHVLMIEKFNTRGAALPAWPDAKRPVNVLNISNTFGNGGEDQTIRALDYLIDATNVLACTAQPGSLKSNASLAGNLWNSLVVGKTSPDFGYAEGAEYENIGNARRKKPDIVACSFVSKDGGASSWSAPVVSSAAAMLIERARATENTKRAERNYVLKAILMAGAAKTGLFSPVYDASGKLTDADKTKPWLWSRTPEAPLDKLYGAGNLQIASSYRILEAGEQSRDAGHEGWILGEGVTKKQPREVRFVVKEPGKEFSAALVWNRHIATTEGKPYSFTVADLRLELHDSEGQSLQWSDDPGNNVECLWIKERLKPGSFTLIVTSHQEAPENFGLAWRNAP
jgi:hypothetical protein